MKRFWIWCAIILALLLLAGWLDNKLTPPQCKPSTQHAMSQDCINLLYPN